MMKEWLIYWMYAVDKHSLQSPFIYSFFDHFIRNRSYTENPKIESLKSELKSNHKIIDIEDFGAGSVVNNRLRRSVAYIAKTSTSSTRFSILLHNLIEKYQFTQVLELGSSLGLNTLYMSAAQVENLQIQTIEGSKEIAVIAADNFAELNANNIKLHVGNIDDLLTPIVLEMNQIDLAYLDANHTYEATIRYFEKISDKIHENSIVVIDDIHWSPEMKKAWKTLISHPKVTHSADIYDAGILFFKEGLQKKHFILEF
ncbi:MAG: class I SAM-dependent methyltransferase [Bacteroidota bacterium]